MECLIQEYYPLKQSWKKNHPPNNLAIMSLSVNYKWQPLVDPCVIIDIRTDITFIY